MMKRSDIRNAYDAMSPTAAQKDRMFQNILEKAPEKPVRAGKYQSQSTKTSFLSLVPAMAALFAVMILGVFVLRPDSTGPAASKREKVDAYAEIPQLTAAKDWQDYLDSYTGTTEEDVTYPYATWGCYNQEMAAKLDEITASYGLAFRDLEERMTDSVDFLLEEVDLAALFYDGNTHDTGNCAYWDDGQFYVAGTVEVSDTPISYVLHRTYPNVFLSEYAQIAANATLDTWAYTHSNGSRLILGIGDQYNFLYAPVADAVFFAILNAPEELTYSSMEALAETFFFSLEKPASAIPKVYQEIIDTCKAAVQESWDEEKCGSFNISARFAASQQYAASNAGYQILDIDGNGTQELLIGHENYIWNLYTLTEDGTAVTLVSDTNDGTVYHLREGAHISKELTTKEEGWHDCYFLSGAALVQEISLYGDSNNKWKDQLTGKEISLEEARELTYQYDCIDLNLTYFYDLPDYARENNEAVENYMMVIEKYKTALAENWSWEACDQNDISRKIMYTTTNHNNLGWALLDLDSNGVEELIVSDGTQLFDLFTLSPNDGLPAHILSGGEYTYSLCKDSTVERRITNDEFTYWTWLRLSEMDCVEEQKLILDSSLHRYYLGVDKETSQTITENEAGKYLTSDEKAPMELALVPFAEQEQTVVREANYYYEPIIERYRQAIVEAWDPGKCAENGMSMMIGYYGELYDQLGHNQIDLNGDGISELIITDGTNIFDIYTVIVDEEVGAMRYALDSTERNQYFMIYDQTLYCRGSGSAAVTYHTALGVGERDLYVQEGFIYDGNDANGPWFFYDGETKGSAYADAEYIVNSWQPMEISFIPFGDGGLVAESETDEWEQAKQEAFDIIASGKEFAYGEYISWLIPWRNQEFENPRPLYYYLHDANGDGIADLILGYEDEVTAVWSYIYFEQVQKESLTLLDLQEETWSELDESWLTWDKNLIENFLRDQ